MNQWQSENGMALASMIVGIVSIVSSCCCFGGVIAGSLAVILACLSRGDGCFPGRAKIGLGTGIAGIFLSMAAGAAWVRMLSYYSAGMPVFFYSIGG